MDVVVAVTVSYEWFEDEEVGLRMQVVVALSGEEAIDGEIFVTGEMVIGVIAEAGSGGWKRLYQQVYH